jgi:hypothetical protein
MRSALLALAVAAAALGALGTGCAHVSPYERESLSHPSMDAESEAGETAFRAHVHDAREGATGGHGSSGGGCGCN